MSVVCDRKVKVQFFTVSSVMNNGGETVKHNCGKFGTKWKEYFWISFACIRMCACVRTCKHIHFIIHDIRRKFVDGTAKKRV